MQEPTTPHYEPPFNPTEISVDTWKIFFAQAEKRLDGTIKNAELISARSQTFVTLLSGIIVTGFGFAVSQLKDGDGFTSIIGVYAGLFALYVLFKLSYGGLTGMYKEAGTEPETMLQKEYTGGDTTEQQQWAYENLIVSYQERIDTNLKVNLERWKILNWTRDSLIVMVCSLPFLYAAIAILLWWIRA